MTAALEPKPWPADRKTAGAVVDGLALKAPGQVVWLSNGFDEGTAQDFAKKLERLGAVTVLAEEIGNLPSLVLPPVSERTGLTLAAQRPSANAGHELRLLVRDERGGMLLRKTLTFDAGKTRAEAALDIPVELRNRVSSIEAENQKTAGGVVLVDERWRRRPVGIMAAVERRRDQPLLDDVHYLERALDPFTEVRQGPVADLLKREIALLIIPDSGRLGDNERKEIEAWMAKGGLVVRFAGPQLATASADAMLPVRLAAKCWRSRPWTSPTRRGRG
jgi:hypothetical protein